VSATLSRPARSTNNHTRPRLEALEDWLAPAALTVNNDFYSVNKDLMSQHPAVFTFATGSGGRIANSGS
jgi:hypothetical protein